MATVDWPAIARIRLEGFANASGPRTRRSGFDSAAVRQVEAGSAPDVREARVDVADGDVSAFQDWVRSTGGGPFNLTLWPDRVAREWRIQGGRVTLSRGVGRIEGGSRYLSGRVTLESLT